MLIGILEDDPSQGQAFRQWLEDAGHQVLWFDRAQALLRELKRQAIDFLVLDWEVPDQTGLDVLHMLRSSAEQPRPILFVTNHDSEGDIVTALAAGADDYIVKPVRRGELIARVEAVWRRYRRVEESDTTIIAGPYRFERAGQRVFRNGEAVEVTQKEFELAWIFFRNPNRLMPRALLLESVWGLTEAVETRTMDTHVSRLRRKLQLQPETGFRLVSVYSYGYRLESVGAPGAREG